MWDEELWDEELWDLRIVGGWRVLWIWGIGECGLEDLCIVCLMIVLLASCEIGSYLTANYGMRLEIDR